MIKREVREKRNNLCKEGSLLQKESWNKDYNKAMQLREKQEQIYKQWQFYNNFIKASEEVNNNVSKIKR